MTAVEAMVEAIKATPGGGPILLVIAREKSLAAFGEAEFKISVTCPGMYRLTWRLRRAFSCPGSTCATMSPGDAQTIAEFLAPEPSEHTLPPRTAMFFCPCGRNHTLFCEKASRGFRAYFCNRKPSKLLWRLRDALWPKDYAVDEILLTAGQAARLAAFLRRWSDVQTGP